MPLGKAVSTAVTTLLVNEGRLDPRRCLLGFPHPSGANNGRVAAFLRDPSDLAAHLDTWFGAGARNIRFPDLARAERAPASAGPVAGLNREEPRTALLGMPAPRPPRAHNQANVRAKTIYLAELLSSAWPGLRAARMGTVRTHGHSRRIELPPDLPVAAHSEVRLMASQSYTRLTLVTLAPSGNPQESEALLEVLKQRYADALAAHLPERTQMRWHARTTADVIDFASLQIHNGGYATGDPSTAAAWVVTCCQAWVGVLRADPIRQEELNSVMA